MKQKPSSRRKRSSAKSVLRLPDLEHAKAAVLNSLNSMDAKRGDSHAIDEFVDWYCSEPRLAFNRIVVLRYRSHLESPQLAPGTINLRLGAVRRLAYQAADCGLLSADLASGIRDRFYGMRGYSDITRLASYYSPARGQRNQEKVILCFQGYFLISAGQFCTSVKGWFSSFTSPVLMRNFLPSAVTV
jgi:hypothetical protein